MTQDFLSFVDPRVTLDEHPINELIRNTIQLKFSEPTNDLRIHVGSVGVQYRLVSY